ncbi:MAG: adenine phosphoribosyltransferase [Desulfurococcales archaeon]|nr:adenine phosphoribosyltransferase [Desulfurococcales archaeon]
MLADVRIFAIELLRSFKKVFKYKELEAITGLPAPALWRYINMKIMPSEERAHELISKLTSPPVINKIFENNIITVNGNIFNLTRIIYNVSLLKIFAFLAFKEFQNYNITAVATVEVDGIPVAVNVADVLDTKLVIARKSPDIGIKSYYETSFIATDPPAVVNLFMPTNALNINDRVLVVDDLLRTGKTSSALMRLVKMSGASPVGVFSILAVGDKWRASLENEVEKIYIVKHLPG